MRQQDDVKKQPWMIGLTLGYPWIPTVHMDLLGSCWIFDWTHPSGSSEHLLDTLDSFLVDFRSSWSIFWTYPSESPMLLMDILNYSWFVSGVPNVFLWTEVISGAPGICTEFLLVNLRSSWWVLWTPLSGSLEVLFFILKCYWLVSLSRTPGRYSELLLVSTLNSTWWVLWTTLDESPELHLVSPLSCFWWVPRSAPDESLNSPQWLSRILRWASWAGL